MKTNKTHVYTFGEYTAPSSLTATLGSDAQMSSNLAFLGFYYAVNNATDAAESIDERLRFLDIQKQLNALADYVPSPRADQPPGVRMKETGGTLRFDARTNALFLRIFDKFIKTAPMHLSEPIVEADTVRNSATVEDGIG